MLGFVEKEVENYKGWLKKTTEKVSNATTEKEVEQKVVNNLELMKLLMNSKIESNDFIYGQLG